jgi:hypothetical protein
VLGAAAGLLDGRIAPADFRVALHELAVNADAGTQAGEAPAEAPVEPQADMPAPDAEAEDLLAIPETLRREPGAETAVEPPAQPALVMPERPAKAKSRSRREGTKQALLIDMLRRPEGATVDDVVHETGWQRHTVRGAIAGAIKKKLGLEVTSEKVEGVGRVYRLC